jgi:hypothetical protein
MAVSATPLALRPTATSSGPISQGLGARSARRASPPATVSTSSSAKPGHHCTASVSRCEGSAPRTPSHWKTKGVTLTTSRMRRLWAAAIRSTRAPLRSPWMAISEAPPIAPAKKAVAGSSRAKRRSAQARVRPTARAQTWPTSTRPRWLTRRPTTSAVKKRPSAVPITQWPALRAGSRLPTGRPWADAIAQANRGPISQGSGVCSQAHRAPADRPMSSASRKRRRAAAVTVAGNIGEGGIGRGPGFPTGALSRGHPAGPRQGRPQTRRRPPV